ncbi:InlB B-repeat-containing protein [Bifidobacterium panos]|uniref:Listeria-Bacteroides repeat domain n=1 Tax=Bifidobacterium panos TaxID=2675321 RepID=A0ABX1SXG2_9BIFI|nr:InlB B-repeat-containing protein [Bifidobacterium sp. DSM 109963]NMN02538.1 Listeria-Bacteroides repeat domain [Bifidobacterium sp. DSM 109963]
MVRFSSQSGLGRGLSRWLVAVLAAGLAALMVLAVAVPAVWAADKPSVTLNENRKTNVQAGSDTVDASYQLGNASVSGSNSSYVVVQVDSGYFIPAAAAPGSAEAQDALSGESDSYGSYVDGADVKANGKYTYVTFKMPKGGADITADQLQTYLRGLTFYTDGDTEQKVSVTVVGSSLSASYNNKDYEAVLYNGHAYMFVDQTLHWDESFGAAKTMNFYGAQGHLLTIESADEHNLIYKSFGNAKGWIGATRFTTAAHAGDDPNTYDITTYESDADYGQNWYWVTGPSAGTKIWNGATRKAGSATSAYNNWSATEPNNGGSGGGEGCAQYGQGDTGTWNDLNNTISNVIDGFYVEFENYDLTNSGSVSSATTQRVDVSYDLDGGQVSTSDTVRKAVVGGAYTATLTATDKSRVLDASSVSVSVGGKVLAKDTDYTFDTATGELAVKAESVTGDISISAKVMRNVTFVLGEDDTAKTYGSTVAPTPQSVPSGSALGDTAKNPAYVKPVVTVSGAGKAAGKKFVGWKSSVDNAVYTVDEDTDDLAEVVVSSDVTFTAQYADTDKMTVRFDYAGGVDADKASSKTLTGREGTSYDVPVPSRAGYAFAGWTTTSTTVKPPATGDKTATYADDVTFTATWTAKPTEVKFSAGEGDNKHGELKDTPASLSVVTEEKLSTDTNYPKKNGPTVTPDAGWRFLYWQSSVTDADKNETLGPVYQPSQVGDLKAQAGLKFTAVYEQLPEVSVVYNFNGGTDADNNTSVTLKGVDGTEYTDEAKAKVPDTTKLTRTGYTFDKWDTTDTGKYASKTYTAQWKQNTNNVNFVVAENDKHGSLTGNTGYQVLTGEKVGGKPTVTADGGYRFVGWVSSENQKVYSQDSVDAYVVSGANKDITFTAKFVPESSVEVHYNYAGGYNKNNDSSLVLTGLEGAEYSDADKTAAAEVPTRTGYTFKQWDKTLSTTYQSVTYTAEWTVNPNTVTFDKGDHGTALDSTTQYTVNSGEKVPGEPTATPEAGYTFVGWKSSEDGLLYGKDGVKDKYVVSGLNPEVTFTARYEPNNGAKAVFNANGGLIDQKDSSVTREGKQGETYTKPSNPTRDGYTFVKWQDADGNEPTGTYATDGTTVYVAQWEADSYGLSFKQGDHGALTGTLDYKVATDAKLGDAGVVAPKVESEAGWSLVGWQSEEYGLVTSDQLAGLVMPAKGVEFTAQYAQNATATVTFGFDGGTDAAGNAWTMLSGPLGTKYDVPANPTKDGYTFKQWDKQVSGTFDEASLQVTAQWTANENTLTFNKGDHGTLKGTTGYTVATDASLKDAKVTAPTVACEAGWSFVGWLSDEYGLVTSDELASLTMPGKNVTLTAQYVQNATGVVVFAYNGGTDKDGNASNIQSGALGTAYTVPADPTRTGYTFDGWDRDVKGDKTFTQSMLQINATWKANTYKITYKLDGGTDPKNPTSYTYGVGATLKNPTREGYTFAGWADANGNLVSGISASDTGDKTLTAKWTKNASTDGLNPDGGTIPSDWTGSDGQLPIPTRDGYKFDGWFDEDGNQVTTLKDAVGKNLTAKWTKIDDAFDPGDGTLPKDWTGADGELPTPTLPGYKFDGWYDEDGNQVTTVKDAVGKKLHAKWTKIDDAFDPDGGTLPDDWTGEDGELPTPSRDGYRFDGWYDENGNKVTTLKDAAGKKLTAHWTKLPTTFDVDGDVTLPDDWTGEDGKLPVPTKPGYKFDGWYDEDGNPVTNADDAAGKKLHPKWTPIDEGFNPDGGTLPDNWTGEDGKLPIPTKPGYKFDGWYDEDGNLITNTEDAAGKKLHPKWTPVDEAFDTDGGNLPSGWTGEDGKLPIPSKQGYKFDGWYDEDGNLITNTEDAIGKKLHAKWTNVADAFDVDGGNLPSNWTGADGKLPLAYKPGYKFDGWYDEQGNLITSVEDAIGKKLHVKWTSVADAFDPNGGNIPADWTGEDGKLPTPTRDGYKFDGWYDDEGNLVTSVEDAIGKKLHARWTKVNALASTGATGFAAGLTALALAATGFAASALRRRRSH